MPTVVAASSSPSTSRQYATAANGKPESVLYTSRPDDSLPDVRYDDDPTGHPPQKDGSTKHKEKIGHRRIDRQGEITYKRVPTNALMGAIQLGIANSVGSLASRPKRDLLVQDFDVIETVIFPSDGSTITPSHPYGDFRFKTYAPLAFRYFREIFNIQAADFLNSLCNAPLRELSNPGASGSIFYVSSDDKFIIKTVQHKEADFLCKLLPGYYMNLQQNPRTVLPKFFGLFCYQSLGKNIRLIVMNNLLPQSVKMHEKFDLKGSTYKRFASRAERAKNSPTLKDLDFNEEYPNGITLDPKTYDILIDVIRRDCLVLESFKIMDYSFLIGVHNIDLESGGMDETTFVSAPVAAADGIAPLASSEESGTTGGTAPNQAEIDAEEERKQHSARTEAWRALQLDFNAKQRPYEEGGVPARNQKGERLLLFLGIIDILQNYRLFKKLEHTWKSILHDGDSISVHNPSFYAERFQDYIMKRVFLRAELTQPKHPNKFRSIVHSYMAIKQHPSKHLRTKSIADGAQTDRSADESAQPRDRTESAMEPLLPQRNTAERRSQVQKQQQGAPDSERRKRMERLFASPASESFDNSTTAPTGQHTTTVHIGDDGTSTPSTSRRPIELNDIRVRID